MCSQIVIRPLETCIQELSLIYLTRHAIAQGVKANLPLAGELCRTSLAAPLLWICSSYSGRKFVRARGLSAGAPVILGTKSISHSNFLTPRGFYLSRRLQLIIFLLPYPAGLKANKPKRRNSSQWGLSRAYSRDCGLRGRFEY